MIKKQLFTTSFKFYWGVTADFKGLASNLALNASIGNRIELPNKFYM